MRKVAPESTPRGEGAFQRLVSLPVSAYSSSLEGPELGQEGLPKGTVHPLAIDEVCIPEELEPPMDPAARLLVLTEYY